MIYCEKEERELGAAGRSEELNELPNRLQVIHDEQRMSAELSLIWSLYCLIKPVREKGLDRHGPLPSAPQLVCGVCRSPWKPKDFRDEPVQASYEGDWRHPIVLFLPLRSGLNDGNVRRAEVISTRNNGYTLFCFDRLCNRTFQLHCRLRPCNDRISYHYI